MVPFRTAPYGFSSELWVPMKNRKVLAFTVALIGLAALGVTTMVAMSSRGRTNATTDENTSELTASRQTTPTRAQPSKTVVPTRRAAPRRVVALPSTHPDQDESIPTHSPPDDDELFATLKRLDTASIDRAWEELDRVQAGFRVAPESSAQLLYDRIPQLKGTARVIAAELLTCRREDTLYARGQRELLRIAVGAPSTDNRVCALRLLARKEYAPNIVAGLRDLSRDPRPRVVIQSCLALWEIRKQSEDLQPLFRMLANTNLRVRDDAALALAETGHDSSTVRDRLFRLRHQPSERGRRAALLLARSRGQHQSDLDAEALSELEKLQIELKSYRNATVRDKSTRGWHAVIEEVVTKALKSSVRSRELTRRDLFLGALHGLMKTVDPYAKFLAPNDRVRPEQTEDGLHRGFGIRLLKIEPYTLVAARVDKNGPAYRSGIRTADHILTLNGVSVKHQSFELVRTLVQSSPGELHLLVQRIGWAEPKHFLVARSDYPVPYVKVRHLPRGVAFLRIARFGRGTADDFAAELVKFKEHDVRRLIIDLRDNPGGVRGEAVRIVDLLINDELGLPIVTLLGAKEERPQWPDVKPIFDGPVAVLVNRGTASSSELVAAALQDMGRARIIGSPTFGKGLEQSLLSLSDTPDEVLGTGARILLSTSSIRRPLGQPLEDGVKPDITVDSYLSLSADNDQERYRVSFALETDRFIEKHLRAAAESFNQSKLWDPASASGFAELYVSLETSLSIEDVRRTIQNRILLHLEDQIGKEFIGEFVNDPPLQRAILEVLIDDGHTPLDIPPEYRPLFDEHFHPSNKEPVKE